LRAKIYHFAGLLKSAESINLKGNYLSITLNDMKKILTACCLLLTLITFSGFGLTWTVKKPWISVYHANDPTDSILADRKHYVDELRLAIKGKENLPGDSVFKNIKILKGVPAARLISIMDMGYANSLGVTCGHCHENGHWEVEVKPTKEITREMIQMTNTINGQLLKNINGLSDNPIVNCTTCHRGSIKPALQMPMPVKGN